jgi:putative transcriptional regulator
MEVRHAIGLSQVGLAREMGISQRTLQDWELGRRQPKGPSKALLQRMLDVLKPPEAAPE